LEKGHHGAKNGCEAEPDMSQILILTATITPPPGVPILARTDPQLRLQDYIDALKFYLAVPNHVLDRIIFAENSGSDLSKLRALAEESDKRVEFFTLSRLDYPPEYGRGYGEFKLMDDVMMHSEIIAELNRSDVVWKATGRYRMKNIARWIATAPANYDLYCDMHDWPNPVPWMDTRFYSCTFETYDRLLRNVYHHLRFDILGHGSLFYMRSAIGKHLGSGRIVPRFRVEPYVEGNRAWDDRGWNQGKNYRNYLIRATSRKITPWLWI